MVIAAVGFGIARSLVSFAKYAFGQFRATGVLRAADRSRTAYSEDVLDPATCAMILASSAGDAIDVFRE